MPMLTPEERKAKLEAAMARLTRNKQILPADTEFKIEQELLQNKETYALSQSKIKKIQESYTTLEADIPTLVREHGTNGNTVQNVVDQTITDYSGFPLISKFIKGLSNRCLFVAALAQAELERRFSDPEHLRKVNDVVLSGVSSYNISRAIELKNIPDPIIEPDRLSPIHDDGLGSPEKKAVQVFD